MLIFYIVCGVLVFAISGLLFQLNRLAIYRRRIIRHYCALSEQPPFILSASQEQQIKHCFLQGISIQKCIERL